MLDINAKKIMEFITCGLGFPVDTEEEACNLIAMTGLTIENGSAELNDNRINYYNDTLFFLYLKDEAWKVEGFTCTAEPGRHYTEVDPNPRGAAHLCYYRQMRYVKGLHKGRKAFVPADGISTVWRDADGDFKLDWLERAYTGAYGIHIHSGGKVKTDIGRWSAGCIAVLGGESGDAWQRILELRKTHPRQTFKVQVVPGYDYFQWLNRTSTPCPYHPTIHIGSKGPHVTSLQKFLGTSADGDFGPNTLKAFKEKQEELGYRTKPMCGPGQWERLLGYSGPYWDEGGIGLTYAQ